MRPLHPGQKRLQGSRLRRQSDLKTSGGGENLHLPERPVGQGGPEAAGSGFVVRGGLVALLGQFSDQNAACDALLVIRKGGHELRQRLCHGKCPGEVRPKVCKCFFLIGDSEAVSQESNVTPGRSKVDRGCHCSDTFAEVESQVA